MQLKRLCEPCRNFCFLGSTALKIGDKELLAFTSYAAGGLGLLALAEPDSGKCEYYKLPIDEGAWAMLQLGDTLLLGTCSSHGCLLAFDLTSRTWSEPLNMSGETYIWNLVLGSDGRVYGGTYPGGLLLRYDHAARKLESLGRMSENFDNLYTRMVYPDDRGDGNLMISCGFASPECVIYNIYQQRVAAVLSGTLKGFDSETVAVGESFYSRTDFRQTSAPGHELGLPPAATLQDGTEFGISGQEYFLKRGGETEYRAFASSRTVPPPTAILALALASDGKLWGSSAFGQTIFCYNPTTKRYSNTPCVCDAGGEVYGLCEKAGSLWMTCYCHGDTVEYKPGEPWDQRGGVNPRTAATAAPELCRPVGGSVVGPDGCVWTGWQAAYGVYGGGITKYSIADGRQSVWRDIVSEQCVCAIEAGDEYIYFLTDNSANGLADKRQTRHLAAIDTEGRLVKDVVFELGTEPMKPCWFDGRLYLPLRDGREFSVEIYSAELEYCKTVPMPSIRSLVRYPYRRCMLAVTDEGFFLLDEDCDMKEKLCTAQDGVSRVVTSPDGKIYVVRGTELCTLVKEQ